MSSHNDKPKGEPEPPIHKEGEVIIGLDKRLADLMSKGWTLVAESCPLESCRCPLLRSLDGNKYCVNCESWIFDKERQKQKFTELVIKGVQSLEVKEQGLQKMPKKIFDFNYLPNKENIINSLRIKMGYLSSVLNETRDMDKTNSILQNIKLCVEDIKMINEFL